MPVSFGSVIHIQTNGDNYQNSTILKNAYADFAAKQESDMSTSAQAL